MGRRSTVTRGSRSSGRRSRRCSSQRSPSSAPSCLRRTTTPARTRSGSPSPLSSSPGSSSIPARAKVTSGQLVLPVDVPVKLTLNSVDVIHSFWVPEFGQKSDAVPGIETTLVITPNRTGQFALMCTELCGLGHATMRAHVRVVTRADYDKFLTNASAGASKNPGEARSRRPAAGPATRSRRRAATPRSARVSTRSSPRRAASRSRSSSTSRSSNPDAVDRSRLPARCDAEDLRPNAVRRAARRTRAVSGRRTEGEQVTEVVHTHPAPHAPAPPRRGLKRVTGPGFIRAAWVTPLFWAIGAGIVVFFRWLGHYEPLWDWPVITVVAFLTAAPLGFLTGIGAFDYWLYYISGRPTRVDDHASHGAYSWKRLLQGQHRPQGDRHPVPRRRRSSSSSSVG